MRQGDRRAPGQHARPSAAPPTSTPKCSRPSPSERLPQAFAKKEGEAYERAVIAFLDALADEVEHRTGLDAPTQVEVSKP